MSDTVLTALLVAIPATITAIGSAIVAVKSSNKAAAQTNELVADNTKKLDAVHKTVNGNFSDVVTKLDASQKENADLRAQLARVSAATPPMRALVDVDRNPAL